MASFSFNWVTNPISNKILSLPNFEQFSLKVLNEKVISILDKYGSGNLDYIDNLVEYSYQTNFMNDELEMVSIILNYINYVPLTFKLEINSGISISDVEIISKYDYLKSIVKHLTYLIFNKKSEDVLAKTSYGNNSMIIHYYPISNNKMIYMDPDLIRKNERDMILSEYLDQTLLSSDLLTPYALYSGGNRLIKSMGEIPKNFAEYFTMKKLSSGMSVYLIDISLKNYQIFVLNFNEYIRKLRHDGYIAISNICNSCKLIPEIAKCWDAKIFRVSDIIVIKNTFDFGIDPEEWYQIAAERIKFGELSQITFHPKVFENLDETTLKELYQTVIIDGSFKLNTDRTVTATFYSIEQYNIYHDLIKGISGHLSGIPLFNDLNKIFDLLDIRLEKLGKTYVISLNVDPYDFFINDNDGAFLSEDEGNYTLELKMVEPILYLNDSKIFRIISEYEDINESTAIELTKNTINNYKIDFWTKYIYRKYGKVSRMVLI